MMDFLRGMVATELVVIGVFFLRFWKQEKDRLFLLFGLSFFLLALNRLVTTILGHEHEALAYVYLIRLTGFVLLIIAIIDKNRSRKSNK